MHGEFQREVKTGIPILGPTRIEVKVCCEGEDDIWTAQLMPISCVKWQDTNTACKAKRPDCRLPSNGAHCKKSLNHFVVFVAFSLFSWFFAGINVALRRYRTQNMSLLVDHRKWTLNGMSKVSLSSPRSCLLKPSKVWCSLLNVCRKNYFGQPETLLKSRCKN